MVDKKEVKKTEEFNEAEPLLAETPIVVINGKEYKLRRLGVGDTFKLARIISVGAAGMGKEIGNIEINPEVVAGLLLAGFPYAERHMMELLASIVGVKYEDLIDPEKFPMGSEISIITALTEHVDVKAFFGKLTGLLKMPAIKEFWKRISTLSKSDTDSGIKK